MYCQLHRPVTSGSSLACLLGHIGDRIYWIQKGLFLPDALGFVPPPYFPILHVGITALVVLLMGKTMLLDPVFTATALTSKRRRGGGHGLRHGFARAYVRSILQQMFEIFVISSLVNIIFLFLYRNGASGQNPEMYSQVMRNKLRQGVIF